ncbi:MAG: gliding motility-associated C-terminal domain-containing protein [Bacteroidetes bacterium]|nr:gliding motility-associated C-terminal domain-containing protein [Bacteroidota bacterium]
MKLTQLLTVLLFAVCFSAIAQNHSTVIQQKSESAPTAKYNMEHNKTIELSKGLFFDDGGEQGNIGNKHQVTTFVGTEGVLELYFTDFNIPYDAMVKIYDGNSTNGDLLAVLKSGDKPWNFKAKNITIEYLASPSNAPGRGWKGVFKTSQITKNPTVQSAPESDCPNAIPLCANNTVIVSAAQYVDLGAINDDNGGCYSGTGSGGSVWYSFTPQATGPLDFLIIPAGSTDYDFVVWDITGGCGSKTEILCNYSATHGNTGASSSGASASEGASGSLLCTRPTVTVGRQYAICINFYGGSNDGYTLQFKNEASSVAITDNVPPTITYVTGNGCTNTTVMDVYFSEWINCTTLQATDFTMPGRTFTMINDYCNGGKTNHVQIAVNPALTAVAGTPSSYTLSVLNSGVGTSMTDMCGNPMNVNYVVTLGVAPTANAGPDKYNCKSPGFLGIGYNYSSVTLNGSGGGAGSIYNWSDGSTGASPSVAPTQTTNYTLTVTQGACTATDVVTVFNETAPTVNLGPDILMCSGLPLTLNASGGGTYQWQVQTGTVPFFGGPTFSNIGGATNSSYSTTPVQYGSTGATYYQVNVTSPHGACTVTDQIKITFGAGSFGILASKPFLCAGETATLSLPPGMNAYTWNTGTSPNAPLVVSPNTTTSYTATSTTAGCTGTAVVTIPVRDLPVVVATATPSTMCLGNTATLTAAPTGSNVTNTQDFESANGFTLVNGSNNKWYWGTAAFATGTKGLYIGTATGNNNYDIGNFITPKTATNHAYRDYAISSFCTSDLSFKWKCGGQAGQAELSVWLVPNTFVPAAGTAITAGSGNVLLGGPYSGQTTYQNVTLNLTPYVGQTARIVFQWVNTGAAIVGGPTVNNPAASIDDVVFTESMTYNYNWSSSPAGLGATSQSLTITPSVVTAYSLTVIRCDGCSNSAAVPLTILPAASALTVSPTSTICAGQSSTLTVTGGSTYTWTPTTGITGSNTTASISVNPTVTTIYTVTSPNCSGTQTKTVEVVVNGSLTVSITPSATSICQGATVALNASGATNYTWSPSGSLNASNNASVTSSAAVTTTYTVTGSDVSGCQGTNTVVVTVNPIPTTTASPSGVLTCATTTVNLNASLAGMNYTWTAPSAGSIASGANSQNAVTSSPGAYSLTVQDPAGNCSYTTTATVIQNTATPSGLSAGTDQTLTCGASVSVTLNGSIASPTSATAAWSGPSVCGVATDYTTSACGAGVYTLQATDPANGCSATSTVQVFPSPGAPSVTVTAVTNTITCTNTLVTVSVSTTDSPVTYSWAGTGIASDDGAGTITVTQGGTFGYTVTNTNSNCTSAGSHVVIQNTAVPTTTASTNGLITCITSTVDLNSSLAGMNYTWTAPFGSSVSNGVNSQNAIGSGAGIYTLVVVDPNTNCTYSTTALANTDVSVPSGLDAGLSQTLSCSSSSVTLTGSFTSPVGTTVTWLGGVCGSATSLTTTACAAGIYTLEAQHPTTGCTTTSTVEVFPNLGNPSLMINSVTNSITCTNTLVSVSLTTTTTPVSVNWSGPGIVGSSTTNTINVNQGGVYTVTLTNTNSLCASISNVTVPTNTTAVNASITGNTTITCTSPNVTLNASPIGSNYTYSWTGSGITTPANNASVSVNAGGNYDVTVTNSDNGCSGIASVVVTTSGALPTATITPASAIQIINCANPTVSLTVNTNPSSNVTYSWSTGSNTQNANVSAPGVISVTIQNTSNGCLATTAYTVGSNTTPPSVSVNNPVIPCGSTTVALSAGTTASNASYSWTTSGTGTLLSGANTSSPIAGSVGQYTVTVFDNDNGCSNTGVSTVTSGGINAAFTANPTSGTAPLAVNFSNQSAGVGNTYSWNFGDTNNNTSALTNPDHTYNATGTYVVTLTVTDFSGLCSGTATLSIEVLENSSLIVPNVFTPNGDGKNDLFKITSTGIKDLQCDIFNRWGTKMYSFTSPSGYWDGGNASDGTYFFILNCTGFDGKEYKQQGYLNLFR